MLIFQKNIVKGAKISLLLCALLLLACSDSGKATKPDESANYTYLADIKPIMDKKCANCHFEDSSYAPFPLLSYEHVYPRRSAIAHKVNNDSMPPPEWVANVSTSRLNDAEKLQIQAWIDAGSPRGTAPNIILYQSNYSYYGHTKAIIEKKCVNCHSPGNIAPFSLTSYEQVEQVAAAVEHTVEKNTMPPWQPTPGYSAFHGDFSLTREQRYILLGWFRGGLALGDVANYVAPPADSATQKAYDVTLTMPQDYTPIERPDDYRCFVMDWPVDKSVYITGYEILPDVKWEVHHVILSIVDGSDSARVAGYRNSLSENDRAGYSCYGDSRITADRKSKQLTRKFPLRQIATWVPGVGAANLPAGTGIKIEPGSLLVMQMHYNTLAGPPKADQSSIGLWFEDEVEREASSYLLLDVGLLKQTELPSDSANLSWTGESGMPIPAGDPNVTVTRKLTHSNFLTINALRSLGLYDETAFAAWLAGEGKREDAFQEPYTIHSVGPHMHNLGTSSRFWLERAADNSKQILIDIDPWNFDWQGGYQLQQEVVVYPQDALYLRCAWDNSPDNQVVDGEPVHVQWGDGSTEEMCLVGIYITRVPENVETLTYPPTVYIAEPQYLQSFKAGDDISLQLRFNNFTLQDPGEHDHSDMSAHDEGHTEGSDHSALKTGHYHVYLDSNNDADEHLTAWDEAAVFQLPDDIEAGNHQLRVSLRAPDHHALGVEKTLDIKVIKDDTAVISEAIVLVEKANWTSAQGDTKDPLASHAPGNIDCSDNHWYSEEGALEVETGYCNYLSIKQASRLSIKPGDPLRLVLWHGSLRFDKPAEAHVAITVNEHIVWEHWESIPSEAKIVDLTFPADFYAEPGDDVRFHLHNHGYNSWTLFKFERLNH